MNQDKPDHGKLAAFLANAYATGLALCLVFFLKTLHPVFYMRAGVLAFVLYAYAAFALRKESAALNMVFLAAVWLVISYLLFTQLK